MNNDSEGASAPMIPATGIPPSTSPHGNFDIQPSHGTEGVLARLFKVICYDITGQRGITLIQWNKLIADYIRNLDGSNTLDRMSVRGNSNKEFRRTSMTWKVFLKGLRILKFLCFNFTVDAELEDGKVVTAQIFVTFYPINRLRELFPGEPFQKFLSDNLVRKGKEDAIGIPKASPNVKRKGLSILLNRLCLAMSDGKGIDILTWNDLMHDHVEKYHSEISKDKKVTVRGNINKELRKGTLAWKVFCKALCFLKVKKFSITVTAIREDGNEFESSTVVTFPETTKAPVFGSYAAQQKKLALLESKDD